VLIAVWLLVFAVLRMAAPFVLGLTVMTGLVLAQNPFNIRARVPGFGSTSRLKAAGAWTGLVVVGLLLTATAAAWSTSGATATAATTTPRAPVANSSEEAALSVATVVPPVETEIPPTQVPPTPVSPTLVPSTQVPPTPVPPTQAPAGGNVTRDQQVIDAGEAEAVPATDALVQQLDRAWAAEDWPSVISALSDLRALEPDNSEYKDKLYAAYVNWADQLLASGDKNGAAIQLGSAVQTDPSRSDGEARLLALTPTPVPPTSTPTPVATSTPSPTPTSVAATSTPAQPQTPPQAKPANSAASAVAFTSVQGVKRGGSASATVQAAPGAHCTLAYTTPSGTASTASGLGPKTADSSGSASWMWKISPTTKPGTGSLSATCDGARATSGIQIS
jgi:hypothetical protein